MAGFFVPAHKSNGNFKLYLIHGMRSEASFAVHLR